MRLSRCAPLAKCRTGHSCCVKSLAARLRGDIEKWRAVIEQSGIDEVHEQAHAEVDAAVEKAMRDGHNGYTASVGVESVREAVAREFHRRCGRFFERNRAEAAQRFDMRGRCGWHHGASPSRCPTHPP